MASLYWIMGKKENEDMEKSIDDMVIVPEYYYSQIIKKVPEAEIKYLKKLGKELLKESIRFDPNEADCEMPEGYLDDDSYMIKTGEDGSLQPVGAVGSPKEGIAKMLDLLADKGNPRKVAVVYATNDVLRDWSKEQVKKKFPNTQITIVKTRAAITAHVGPKAVALVADYGFL